MRSSGSLLRVMTPSTSWASRRIVAGSASGALMTSARLRSNASPSAAMESVSSTRFTAGPTRIPPSRARPCLAAPGLVSEAGITPLDQAQQAAPFQLADLAALPGLVAVVRGFHYILARNDEFLVTGNCKYLGLAGAVEPVHGHEGFRDGPAHGEQAMVAQ